MAAAAHRFGIPYGGPGTHEPETVAVQIPRPGYWGGYRLIVEALELWVEGEFRIHDRARWTRSSAATERGAAATGSPARRIAGRLDRKAFAAMTGGGMSLLEATMRPVPHCWETIELTLDLSVPEQSYIEDCPVCCRPIWSLIVAVDGEVERTQGRSRRLTPEAASNPPRTRGTFKQVRIVPSARMLLVVGVTTCQDRVRSTRWRVPLYVAMYPIAADDSPVTHA